MCGIWAILNKSKSGFGTRDWDIAKAMATMTIIRGEQSSGFASVSLKDNKQCKVTKVLGTPYEIFHDPKIGPQWKDHFITNSDSMFGHGRLATKGKIILKNAHPFREGGITLVHNGTIDQGLDEHTSKDVEVDSHALTHAIAEKGYEEALKNVTGAYAIISHNAKNGKLYIARNYHRPLHYAELYDKILIMSEEEALRYILSKFASKHTAITEFQTSYLYEFDLNEPPEKRKLSKVGDLLPKKTYSPSPAYGAYWGSGYDDEYVPGPSGVMVPASSNLKPNDPPFTPSNIPKGSFSEKYCPGEEVTFMVEKITPAHGRSANKLFKYECTDDDVNEGVRIVFYSKEERQDLISEVGKARVHSVVYGDKRQPIFIVKHKEIVWEEPDDPPVTVNEAANEDTTTPGGASGPFPSGTIQTPSNQPPSHSEGATGGAAEVSPITVTTRDGTEFGYEKWKSITKTHNCRVCEKPVKLFDYDKTYVVKHGNKLRLYCRHCLGPLSDTELARKLAAQGVGNTPAPTMESLVSNILH